MHLFQINFLQLITPGIRPLCPVSTPTAKSHGTSAGWCQSCWGHRAPDGDTARDTIPTYADKCPTSIGDEPPLVADVETADIVEDTIELYILDTTMRKSILKGKDSDGC